VKVFEVGTLAAEAVAHADQPASALLHDSADARVVIFRIEPGQEVRVHTSESTVLLAIVSGSGTVTDAESERAVRAGDLVVYEVAEPHGMRAHEEQLVIAAVIVPRPLAR
jgi:quercetin dioxygenase-like cupin family protein